MNRSTPGFPLICVGFMMYSFTVRPSRVMVFSVVVTPDMSTFVCDCSEVRMSCGFGCGSSQNGALSLLISARNARTCGSIRVSDAGFGAAAARPVIRLVPASKVAIVRILFMTHFLLVVGLTSPIRRLRDWPHARSGRGDGSFPGLLLL